MPEPAIIVEGLSKLYHIGLAEARSDSLVGAAAGALLSPLRNFRRLSRLDTYGRRGGDGDGKGAFWALRDVSFDLDRGEALGVIGRNGAGKSTLLKLLSRITEPTAGRIRLRGRVSSLLEVGTGFHQELTGRENIYLNGTILGMKKREIDRKFDEIVEFSGVAAFLDTPVKRYSSGMTMRLAFAVAAHLEPEILIIDEVLAVGDAEFQRKCLGKMQEISHSGGRTILFVSHNIAAIESLTTKSIYLSKGRLVCGGATSEVLERYVKDVGTHDNPSDGLFIPDGAAEGKTIVQSVEVLGNDTRSGTLRMGDELSLVLRLNVDPAIKRPLIGVGIETMYGSRVLSLSSLLMGAELGPFDGEITIRCNAGVIPLNSGQYTIRLVLASDSDSNIVEIHENIGSFFVIPSDVFGTGYLPNQSQGQFYWGCRWEKDVRDLPVGRRN